MASPTVQEERMRVVIADHDPQARALIKYMLTVQQGAVVVGEAADGFEAAALVEYGHPDLLIMDQDLPDRKHLDRDFPDTQVVRLNDGEKSDVLDHMRKFVNLVLEDDEGILSGDGGGGLPH